MLWNTFKERTINLHLVIKFIAYSFFAFYTFKILQNRFPGQPDKDKLWQYKWSNYWKVFHEAIKHKKSRFLNEIFSKLAAQILGPYK